MRVRRLTATGDMTFGQSGSNFLIKSVAAVAQNVKTRLGLLTGEWFLDLTDGTPWKTDVLGFNTSATYDSAIQTRILGTYGVVQINNYASQLDHATRSLTVTCDVVTVYDQSFSLNERLT